MKKVIAISLFTIFLASCASTQQGTVATSDLASKNTVAKEEKKKKMICKRTTAVGSQMKKKQCWSEEEYAAQRERDIEMLRQQQRSTIAPKK